MTLILALLGVLTAVVGVVLLLKGQRIIGALLILIGIAWVALGAFAILSFHP